MLNFRHFQKRASSLSRIATRVARDWDFYAYDAVDHLVSVKYGAADSAGRQTARSVGYGWDTVGNCPPPGGGRPACSLRRIEPPIAAKQWIEVAESIAGGSGQTTGTRGDWREPRETAEGCPQGETSVGRERVNYGTANAANQASDRIESETAGAACGGARRAGQPMPRLSRQYPSINGHSLAHDGNGNLTSARLDPRGPAGLYGDGGVPTATLAYDSSNRLLSVTKVSDSVVQTYDTRNCPPPFGERPADSLRGFNAAIAAKQCVTSRTINGQTTYFVWDGWDLIEERNASGNQIRRYVHGAGVDEPLMMVDASGPRYYVQDALGSVTALTDEYGAVVESYRYDVFGTVSAYDGSGDLIAGGPAAGNRFLYTGRDWIAEAGLYDYRNRVYSPVLGRFLQNDPIRFEAGDVNLYRYVGNSAVDFVDPMGLQGISNPVRDALISCETAGLTATETAQYLVLLGLAANVPNALEMVKNRAESRANGKGERGKTAKPSGTDNPYKHTKPHPTDPGKIIQRDPHTGKQTVKPKPADYPK